MRIINLFLKPGVLAIAFLIAGLHPLHAQNVKFKTVERIVAVDGGTVQLTNGHANVQFSSKLLKKPNIAKGAYMVTLTPVGDCGALKVVQKSTSGFTVEEISKQSSNASFDYLIFVRRIVKVGLANESEPK